MSLTSNLHVQSAGLHWTVTHAVAAVRPAHADVVHSEIHRGGVVPLQQLLRGLVALEVVAVHGYTLWIFGGGALE